MWEVLFWLERQRRGLRKMMIVGPNSCHLLGVLLVLASLAFLPLAPAGITAAVGLIFLGAACLLTIVLIPVGGCLL